MIPFKPLNIFGDDINRDFYTEVQKMSFHLRTDYTTMMNEYKYSGVPYCPAAESVDIYDSWLKKIWDIDDLPVNYRILK